VEVNPFAGAGGDFSGVVAGAVKVLVSAPARSVGKSKQLDAAATLKGYRILSFVLIHLTTITLAMLISRISSTSGSANRWVISIQICLAHFSYRKLKNWWLRPIGLAATEKKQEHSFEEGLSKAFVRMREIQPFCWG
jgi:hypothetical protein